MVRNGNLRSIKVMRKDGGRVVAKSRDDAHQYVITHYPKTKYNSIKRTYVKIVFNKYNGEKRAYTKTWTDIEDVYSNRRGLVKRLWREVEDFCKYD